MSKKSPRSNRRIRGRIISYRILQSPKQTGLSMTLNKKHPYFTFEIKRKNSFEIFRFYLNNEMNSTNQLNIIQNAALHDCSVLVNFDKTKAKKFMDARGKRVNYYKHIETFVLFKKKKLIRNPDYESSEDEIEDDDFDHSPIKSVSSKVAKQFSVAELSPTSLERIDNKREKKEKPRSSKKKKKRKSKTENVSLSDQMKLVQEQDDIIPKNDEAY